MFVSHELPTGSRALLSSTANQSTGTFNPSIGSTMLSESDRQAAAQLLRIAEQKCEPVKQLSSTWPDITFEDAYAIQNLVQKQKMSEGRKLIGHKVGLTSKAMQRSSVIDEPDYGHLLDDMIIADGAKVPHA